MVATRLASSKPSSHFFRKLSDRPASTTGKGAGYGHTVNRDGARVEYRGDGLAARCFQHELDHLNGKLHIDLHPISVRKRIESESKELSWFGNHALDPRSELYRGFPES